MFAQHAAAAAFFALVYCGPLVASDPALQSSIVVAEGDLVPGAGPVEDFGWASVSAAGDVLVAASLDLLPSESLTDQVLLLNGTTVVHREGDDAPGFGTPEVLGEIRSAELDDAGRLAWVVDLRQMTGSAIETRSVLYLDSVAVLQADSAGSFPGTWPGVTPGTTFAKILQVRVAGTRLCVAASIDDPSQPGFSQPWLGFVDPTTGAQEKIASRGDAAPGTPGTITFVETNEAEFFEANAAGQALYRVAIDALPTGGSGQVIYLDDTIVAIEGGGSPIAGRSWSTLGEALRLTESGDVLFEGRLDGDSSTAAVVVRNGVVVAQAGVTTYAAIAPTPLLAPLGTSTLGDDGDVAYQALWSGTSGQNQGLVLNDVVVLQEGTSTVEGNLIVDVPSFPRTQAASRDGRVQVVEVSLAGVGAAIVRIDRTTFHVLDGGVNGASGLEPLLRGDGSLASNTAYSFTVSGALANASSYVIAGFSLLDTPFKGGKLVPNPDVVVGPIPTGPLGNWSLGATWPTGIPSGFSVWLQAWVADSAGPASFAASDGLVGVTP